MSKPLNLHTGNSGVNVIVSAPGVGIIDCWGTAAPPASAQGFANGCHYRKIGGAADQNLYINEGSLGTASWVVLPTP